MNFENFQKWAKESMMQKSNMIMEADVLTVEKLGKSYTGLAIRMKDDPLRVVIDLDRFYAKYLSGCDESVLADEMAENLNGQNFKFSTDWLFDYQKVKERLFVRLSNYDSNMKIMDEVPNTSFVDLALTYHIRIELANGSVGNTIITNKMLKTLGVSKEQLHSDALKNAKKLFPVCIMPLHACLREQDISNDRLREACDKRKSYIITNEQQIYGASAIFYPGVLEDIATLINRDFYVLPSSIHETIVCVSEDSLQTRCLQNDVREINQRFVREDEWLSDHVYHYDPHMHIFEMVEEQEWFS